MDCAVGQLHDPVHLSGLAHFTEHMTFLGTGKFPEEGCYNEYVETNGGDCNAFTSLENTNYYFRVKASALEGALERFSRFFIDPLFTESATEREMNAIESENQRFSTMDSRRNLMWLKDLAAEGHPFQLHGCGSIDTLKHIPEASGIDVRKEMFNFQRYYRSRSLKLCVFGKEPLDALQAMAVKHFTDIPDKGPAGADAPFETIAPFDKSSLGKMYYVKSVNTNTRVCLYWVLNNGNGQWRAKSDDYLSHLIGHECEGSILRALKDKRWATALCAGTAVTFGKTYGLFQVEIGLSSEGYAHLDEVVHAVFEYIALIKRHGFSMDVYNECKDTAYLSLKYAKVSSPADHASNAASAMNIYPPQHCLSGANLFFQPDPEATMAMLEAMTPSAAIVCVKKNTFEDGEAPVPIDRVTRYYDTHYGVRDIPQATLEEWADPAIVTEGLTLPQTNEFLPNDFEVKKSTDGSAYPTQVKLPEAPRELGHWQLPASPSVDAHFWQDNEFLQPKAYVKFSVESAFAGASPRAWVLNAILMRVLKEELSNVTYYASLANLNVYLSSYYRGGLQLTVTGFSQKLQLLLRKIFAALDGLPDPSTGLFNVSRERFHQELQNSTKAEAHHHAGQMLATVVCFRRWTIQELLREIETVTLAELVAFKQAFRNDVQVRCLLTGNLAQSDAEEMLADVHNAYLKRCRGMAPSFAPPERVLQVPATAERFYIVPMAGTDPESKNSVVTLSFQIGPETTQNLALAQVFDKLIRHVFFYHLRTVEQLGYVVQSYAARTEGVVEFEYTVQSAVASPWYVFSRMYAFLAGLDAWVEALPAADFRQIVDSLLERKREKPKTLQQKFSQWWVSMDNRQHDFDRVERAIAFLETVTQEEFTAYYRRHLSLASPERRVLGVFLHGSEQQDELCPLREQWAASTPPRPVFPTTRPLECKSDSAKETPADGEDAASPAMDGYAAQFAMQDTSERTIALDYVMQVAEFRNCMAAFPSSSLYSKI
eukprot:TRINITY_DN1151_c2_g1_i1.p1 TRINITY_DN1151_c2_g1~~TRINITY_DN1151_c2_g1_i1.p1  ORF type:complete len:1057 (+),score=327.19 TRINITY_DN1151_c2_g1_i1:188-3172(+)